MKRITKKCALLLTTVLGLLLGDNAYAQCGPSPIATPGSIACNGQTTSVPIDLQLLGGPYNIQPYLDYNYPTIPMAAYATNYSGSTYTLTNQGAGIYKIYIVDVGHGGCYDSVMYTLTEPGYLNFNPGASFPNTCADPVSLGFTMLGGTTPYTISYTQDSTNWYPLTTTSNGSYTTTTTWGAWSYKLTDANGCVVDHSYTAFGYAPNFQSHWYVGLCGVDDSSVSYLTGGNQTIARNVNLLMKGLGHFSDNLKLVVDYGDNTPAQTYTTQVKNSATPISLNHTYAATGVYMVTYKAINLSTPDTAVIVEFINNNSDVYPGDTDGDGVANNMDVLNLGIGFANVGPPRAGASLSWVPQPASDWSMSFITGLDYKHADCDGDGAIDFPDTLAIVQNYGQSHVMRVGDLDQVASPSDPTLRIDFPSGNYPAGSHVTVPVTLGTSVVPANNIYGIAFTVNYPANAIDASNVGVSFNGSMFGSVGTNAVAIRKNFPSAAGIDIAISSTTHMNMSGFGTVCDLEVITIDNVSGKLFSTSQGYLKFTNVRLIDKDGNELPFNTQKDTITFSGTSGVIEHSLDNINVYPNPAKEFIQLTCDVSFEEVQLVNILGEVVFSSTVNAKEIRISTESITNGVYMLRIGSGTHVSTRRIVINK
jgi:hypothetical protein